MGLQLTMHVSINESIYTELQTTEILEKSRIWCTQHKSLSQHKEKLTMTTTDDSESKKPAAVDSSAKDGPKTDVNAFTYSITVDNPPEGKLWAQDGEQPAVMMLWQPEGATRLFTW